MVKNKQKETMYYAIKEGKGVRDKIVSTWEECKSFTDGYDSVYKVCSTILQANLYLIVATPKTVSEETRIMREEKKKNRETSILCVSLTKELHDKLEEKCNQNGWENEEAVIKLIEDWIN